MDLMDDEAVREHAAKFCDALVAGDIERATEDFSNELRQHLGEVLALLPLPATAATIDSMERGGAGWNVVVRLVGETEEVLIQTRWKDRDGRPTIVEASHLSAIATAPEGGDAEGAVEDGGAETV